MLRPSILRLLQTYNTQPGYNCAKYDKNCVEILMNEFFGSRELSADVLDENVVKMIEGMKCKLCACAFFKTGELISGFFIHRVDGDRERLNRFSGYLNQIWKKKKEQ